MGSNPTLTPIVVVAYRGLRVYTLKRSAPFGLLAQLVRATDS